MRRSPPRSNDKYDRNRADERFGRGGGSDRGGRYRDDRIPRPDQRPERRMRSEERHRDSRGGRERSRDRSREARRMPERERGYDRKGPDDSRGALQRPTYRPELFPPNSNDTFRSRDPRPARYSSPPPSAPAAPSYRPSPRNDVRGPSGAAARPRDLAPKVDPRDLDLQVLVGERRGRGRPGSGPPGGARGGARSRGPPPRSKPNADLLDAAMDDYWKQDEQNSNVQDQERNGAPQVAEERTLSADDSAANGEPPPPGLEDQ